MRIKKILFLVGVLLLSTRVMAQRTWSAGVPGSYGHYKFNQAERQFGQYLLHIYDDNQPLDMWRLGVFGRMPLGGARSPLYLQAELDHSVRSGRAQLENTIPTSYPLDFYISSPIPTMRRYDFTALLGVQPLRLPIRLLAGPVVGFTNRRKLLQENGWSADGLATPYRQIENDLLNGFNRVVVGYQLGAGVDLWRFSLDLRRENNITPVVGQVRHNGQTYRADVTGQLWMVTLGIRAWEKEKPEQTESANQ